MRALVLSLGLHVAAFFALMYAPPLRLPTMPEPSPSEYRQAFAGREDKIVWYKFRDLPAVTPQNRPAVRQPLRAEVKAKQTVVSSPRNAPKRNQVVLTPAPPMDLPPLDLPNLIAVKLPPRPFTTPPELVRPEARKIDVPDAVPNAAVQPLEAMKMRADHLPQPRAAAPKIEVPTEAPEYKPAASLVAGLPAPRLPSRRFVPPAPQAARESRQIVAAAEAPALAVTAPKAMTMRSDKLPARAFAPPPVAAVPDRRSIAAPTFDGPPGDLTIAVASLNPAMSPVSLPAASSPAQFSAGEKVRPEGATSDGLGKGITVADLYAHPATERRPELAGMAYVNTSRPAIAPLTTSHATSTRVGSAPDPRFNGRDVYMMAIQMPNLTSYSGSWLMWYADRTARATELQPIAAPVAHRKVDPKYIATAVEERIEGRVQLYCVIGREGTVTSIELLHGIDDRLDRSAVEALSKWEFYPATRNGQPVDVDVVVEIPFVLAPRAAK
jgi:TonB family protein